MIDPVFKEAVDSAGLVAFDVFDTLLVRPFYHPVDVFYFLEKRYKVSGFGKTRHTVERRARKKIRPEIDIDDIYSLMPPEMAFMKEHEVEFEKKIVFSDPDVLDYWQYAVDSGKTVVIMSDMYLRTDVLKEMLDRNVLKGYDRIFCSCDLDASKHSGSMYDIVLKEYGVEPEKMLVIGDNPISEKAVPRSKGIKVYPWTKVSDRYRKCHRKEIRYVRKNDADRSVLLGMDMLMWVYHYREGDYWQNVGRRFGGPMVTAFVSYIINHTPEDVDRLLFFSRDGFMAMRIYEELDGNVPFGYIYTSRYLSNIFKDGAEKDSLNASNILMYIDAVGRRGELEGDGSDVEIVRRNSEIVRKILEEGRETYSRYVKSMTSGSRHTMYVDITTKMFTSQRAIDGFVDVKTSACYYAITGRSDLDYMVFADRSRDHLTWSLVNLAEMMMASGESNVLSVSEDGVPQYAKGMDEALGLKHKAIQEGEVDYARFFNCVFDGDLPDIGNDAVDRWIKVLISMERGNDPDKLSGMLWPVGTGNTDYVRLLFRWGSLSHVFRTKMGRLITLLKR